MPYFNPTYGGFAIFGLVESMDVVDQPTATQVDAFFGQAGTVALFGGTRGRTIMITGVFEEEDIPGLNSDEQVVRSYADGIARTLVDTRGRSWPNVIFKGEFQTVPKSLRPSANGFCIQYKAVFHGLT